MTTLEAAETVSELLDKIDSLKWNLLRAPT